MSLSDLDRLLAQIGLGHVDAGLFASVFLNEFDQLGGVVGSNQELAVDTGSLAADFFGHGVLLRSSVEGLGSVPRLRLRSREHYRHLMKPFHTVQY